MMKAATTRPALAPVDKAGSVHTWEDAIPDVVALAKEVLVSSIVVVPWRALKVLRVDARINSGKRAQGGLNCGRRSILQSRTISL